jgi:hypothetical protein
MRKQGNECAIVHHASRVHRWSCSQFDVTSSTREQLGLLACCLVDSPTACTAHNATSATNAHTSAHTLFIVRAAVDVVDEKASQECSIGRRAWSSERTKSSQSMRMTATRPCIPNANAVKTNGDKCDSIRITCIPAVSSEVIDLTPRCEVESWPHGRCVSRRLNFVRHKLSSPR